MPYEQAEFAGARTPGHDCKNCGRPGFEHERERVTDDEGRFSYNLACPGGSE